MMLLNSIQISALSTESMQFSARQHLQSWRKNYIIKFKSVEYRDFFLPCQPTISNELTFFQACTPFSLHEGTSLTRIKEKPFMNVLVCQIRIL